MILTAELVAWWAVAVGTWMASLSAYSTSDLIVACGCALPCAAAAAGARRALRTAWRPPVRALRWLALLPVSVAVDTVRVLALPVRRGRGRMRTIELRNAKGGSAAASGRRAAAALVVSATPASYVVSVDEEEGTALLHVVGAPSALERAISR